MLKNKLNQIGAKELSKNEQKMVIGKGNPDLCQEPIQYCENGREFDPCEPFSDYNRDC